MAWEEKPSHWTEASLRYLDMRGLIQSLCQPSAGHRQSCMYPVPINIGLSGSQLEVKNPPANAGDARDADSIPGLGGSPGEGMTTHSSILAWEIPWTEEPRALRSMGSQRGWTQLSTHATPHPTRRYLKMWRSIIEPEMLRCPAICRTIPKNVYPRYQQC